jgi:hypothetical protein
MTDRDNSLDLSGDNELPEVLEERERLRLRIAVDQARFAEIRNLLMVKLGDADSAFLAGWTITREVKLRRAHEVPEKEITYVKASRVPLPHSPQRHRRAVH